MSRGGKRKGSGSKPKWRSGKTKTVRVPESLAQEILQIAHKLDEGDIIDYDTESKIVNLSGVSIGEVQGRKIVFLDDLLRMGYEIKPLKLADIVRKQLLKR